MSDLPNGVIPVGHAIEFTFSNREPKQTAFVGNVKPVQLDAGWNTLRYPVHPLQTGFIKGTITARGAIAPNRNVFAHDDTGCYVADTISDAQGKYQFDGLLLNRWYTITAHDNDEYKYAPVGADRRTPEAYP